MDAVSRVASGLNRDTCLALFGSRDSVIEEGMISVKRSVMAEQVASYADQLAAVATLKKQLEDCKVIADKAYKSQQALHDNWTALTAQIQSLQEEKARLQEQNASLRSSYPQRAARLSSTRDG
ncbi:hypothetical protein WJX82_006014 [Trebouxia sp. C0006]